MRIVPIVPVLILTLSTTAAFAGRSRCRQVACESAPAVCSSAPVCVKPVTVCCTPQPTVIALAEEPVPAPVPAPVAAPRIVTAPVERKPASVKRAMPLSIDSVDPDLNAHLAEWEKASSRIHRLDCEFRKFIYHPIFEVERRGRGTIAVERDSLAKYRIVPETLNSGDVSNKIGKDGNPYALQVCTPDCWHWTGSQFFKFNDHEHLYEEMILPPGKASYLFGFIQFTDEALDLLFLRSFVLGMPAEQLKRRFKIRLLTETSDELWLELVPRRAEDSRNFQRAVLILDRGTWLTRALKMYDPTGSQTVHIFQNVKVNSAEGDDLSKANLEGYRPVSNDPRANETSK